MIVDIFVPLFQIFENGYKLGEVIWTFLNSPFSDFVGEDFVGIIPGFMVDSTLLEVCFGPILFYVIIYKIVASFIPLG